jgi:hypothetical protein
MPTQTFTQTIIPSKTLTPTLTPNHDQMAATAYALFGEISKTDTTLATDPEVVPTLFYIDCNHFYTSEVSISSKGDWLVVSCGYYDNPRLIFQNKTGQKWITRVSEYAGIWEGDIQYFMNINPLSWSSDGKSFYFSISSPGGCGGSPRYCYNLGNMTGLYLLNLETGIVQTIIEPNYDIPQAMVEFSHSGRFYAINRNGLQIVDTKSYSGVTITSMSIFSMSWSPDDRYLAYAVAECDENQFMATTSEMYIFDRFTGVVKKIDSIDSQMFWTGDWVTNTKLSYQSHDVSTNPDTYTVYEYDLAKSQLSIIGTVTPYPYP